MKTFLLILTVVVGFWNVENLFEPGAEQMEGKGWSKSRYYSKCRGIGKVIASLGDSLGCPPDIFCLAEVQSAKTVRDIIFSDALRKFGYRYVHFDSPDRRGIDCALIYRQRTPLKSSVRHITDKDGSLLRTRDILLVEFADLNVLVAHLPSKLGHGNSRATAQLALKGLCDSLGTRKPLAAIGDFNEERSVRSDSLFSPLIELSDPLNPGTIRFQGRWETIDRAFVSGGTEASVKIMALDALTEPDTRYGGTKPRRTYIGPRWHGGLSDHYPVVVWLKL